MNNEPFEDLNAASSPVPSAKPSPFIDRIVVILTIILLGIMTLIGLYFG